MFIQYIKKLIEKNPNIVSVTNRGLEDKNRNVIFIAKDLLKRYPELESIFNKEVVEVKPKKSKKQG